MNCIFICIFNNKQHITLLYLLLESLFIFGNLRSDTDILIYTSTEIMNIIKSSHLYNEKIKFETNDTYNDVDSACKSRLDLFALPSANKYDKFLYLDTDILIFTDDMRRDINSVFELATDDILYAVEEGTIDASENYYGKKLFGDDAQQYEDKSAFSSGILLFKNCEKMKFLFGEIKECMRTRKDESDCYDQPFIIYNAFKYNLYDNQKLKQFALNQDTGFSGKYVSGKIINHFYGDPTARQIHIKIQFMQKILQELIKPQYISHIIDVTKQYINEYLLPIIRNIGEPLEGNIFMQHLTTDYNDALQNKPKNISNLLLNQNIQNVMEIGFNSGFSALLMLISNPTVKLTCFDLGEHKYTLPCYQKMRETFGDRIQLIIGDSTQTLKNVNDRFDLIHIDGGHSTEVAESDIIHSYRLSKKGTIFIMDDYDFPNLHYLWDKFIGVYDLKPLNIYTFPSPHHDIKYIAR